MAERKYLQGEIGKDPTKWLESNKLDPFRFGKDMTERKMPVPLGGTIATALLKVDFGSRRQSRVPDYFSTFVKKSTLKSTLLDFKSGKSDLDSTPPWRSTPFPKP